MNFTIDVKNKKELKQQFLIQFPYVRPDYAEEMVNFIFDNIKFSFKEQKEKQILVNDNIIDQDTFDNLFQEIMNKDPNLDNKDLNSNNVSVTPVLSSITSDDVIKFVKEINGALVDNIQRNGTFLYGDGKNDSNNLKQTARYRETYMLGKLYQNDIENIIKQNTYEDAILLGNFFVSTIFDYANNFHVFNDGSRKSLILPNNPEGTPLYEGLFSAEEYEKILCKKLNDILGYNLDTARIFFGNELSNIIKF